MACAVKLAILSLMVSIAGTQVLRSTFPRSTPLNQLIATQSEVVKSAGNAVKREMIHAKEPADAVLANAVQVASSQCSNMKKLAGVDYESVMRDQEPDLDQLTLNFYSGNVHLTFKLGESARFLPKAPGYDGTQSLLIFLHGFIDDPRSFNFRHINEAFQSTGHHNILALDASSLIRWLYLRSSTYVRLIGERLGDTLAAMLKSGLDRKDIHLVGHSLGSHIAGFAGKTFRNHTGTLVGRISGLDPAGPCFTHVDPDLKLERADAEFVDVIHTDAGVFGLSEPIGHVDFYPNGGSQQPSCLVQTCDHMRVVELFAESVRNPEAFPALACTHWEEFKREQCSGDISMMGYPAKASARGRYYLRTAGAKPYSLGKEGLLNESEGIVKTLRNMREQLVSIMV